ncbi:MAG: amino acid permease, partial [Pseudomonadota bacterium]|nr:amino acid permease [Pseudomonadota bacterium]
SLGAIFYITMDIAVHWGILRHLRDAVDARPAILVSAIILDAAVLGALLVIKASSDMTVVYAAIIGFIVIFGGERLFLRRLASGGAQPE